MLPQLFFLAFRLRVADTLGKSSYQIKLKETDDDT